MATKKKTPPKKKPKKGPPPWGRLGGLAMAVVVTLTGIAQSVEPWEILRRSATAFGIVSIVIALVVQILAVLNQKTTRASR